MPIAREFFSFRQQEETEIEFRKLSDLSEIVYTYSSAPHHIGTICAASPSTLVYSDNCPQPCEAHLLDCSGSEPRLVDWNYKPDIDFRNICVVKEEGKLVVFHCDGLLVKNFDSGELQWSKQLAPIYGICTDGQSHLFIIVGSRGDSCIQLYRVSDGENLGCILRAGEKGFEDICGICWIHETASLVVAHRKDDQCLFSIVRLEPPHQMKLP